MTNDEITIKDELQDTFPQELEQLWIERAELPIRSKDGNFNVFAQTSLGPCYMKTTVRDNGKIPGDGGNGGRVEIEFQSDYIDNYYGGSSIDFKVIAGDTVKITLLGEWERIQFVRALESIVNELK